MKIVTKYEFDGARGICKNCGTEVILEEGDTGMKRHDYGSWTQEQREKYGDMFPVWFVKCPTCENQMECSFLERR